MSTDRQTLLRAKALRAHQTDAEQRLWHHLRAHRFLGLKFKRQKPIGPYIVDFACVERGLAVELDGGQHADQAAYDEARTRFLHEQGYRVLRFWNDEVLRSTDAVLDQIRLAVTRGESFSPDPSPVIGRMKSSAT